MICFQQSAIAYLKFCKANHLHKLSLHYSSYKRMNFDKNALSQYENKFHKYLDRLYRIILFRKTQFSKIFEELEILLDCQLILEVETSAETADENEAINLAANVPLIDIIVNIDMFNSRFENKIKILTIIQELFQFSSSMQKLMNQHGEYILAVLIKKYSGSFEANQKYNRSHQLLNKGYNLARCQNEAVDQQVIGALIRLYTQSALLSQWLQQFDLFHAVVDKMKSKHLAVSFDACTLFRDIFLGSRI